MNIRRSMAGLLTALALVSGGALVGCEAAPEANTGTPKDTASNTSGSDPGGVSQGNLPKNDSNEVDSTSNSDRDEGADPENGG
jgi:hypothetical protein